MLAEFPSGLLFCTMRNALFHQGAIWLFIVLNDLLSDCLRAGNSACAGNSIDSCPTLRITPTEIRAGNSARAGNSGLKTRKMDVCGHLWEGMACNSMCAKKNVDIHNRDRYLN